MLLRRQILTLGVSLGLAHSTMGLEIDLDYSLDTQGFFNQAGSREALQAVADFFEELIVDELDEIDPSLFPGQTWTARPRHPGTGESLNIVNRKIPANTVLIFVGGRNLSGGTTGQASFGFSISGFPEFSEHIFGRGQTGASGPQDQRTDYTVQIHSITFDLDRTWNFGTSNGPGSEFISTAIHEFCHVFGIGQADSWDNLIVNGNFTGANAMNSFGGNVAVAGDESHWRSDNFCGGGEGFDPDNPLNILSKKIGVFGASHGADQIAIMDPGRCDNGQNFAVITDLELAALIDIGWELSPLLNETFSRNSSGQPSLSWDMVSPFSYRVHRGDNLVNFPPLSAPFSGSVSRASFSDTSAPLNRAFYRIEVTTPETPATLRVKSAEQAKRRIWRELEHERTNSCSCSHSESDHHE